MKGRAPAYRHVVELAGRYGVAEKELEMMIDEVAAAVERWPEFARVARVAGLEGLLVRGFLGVSLLPENQGSGTVLYFR